MCGRRMRRYNFATMTAAGGVTQAFNYVSRYNTESSKSNRVIFSSFRPSLLFSLCLSYHTPSTFYLYAVFVCVVRFEEMHYVFRFGKVDKEKPQYNLRRGLCETRIGQGTVLVFASF